MAVNVLIHLEPTDKGELVWWAESPETPGLSAAANSLVELQFLVRQSIVELVGDVEVAYRLAEDEPVTEGERVTLPDSPVPSSGPAVTRARSSTLSPV